MEALLQGHIDIAWNSPLAWVDAQRRSGGTCRAIAMRDTDRDRVSHVVVRGDSGIAIPRRTCRGRTVAVGAQGLAPGDADPARHCSSARASSRGRTSRSGASTSWSASTATTSAASSTPSGASPPARPTPAACSTSTGTRGRPTARSTRRRYRILATTDRFDHCVFTVRDDFDAATEKRWLDALFAMTYDNPMHREMMDLEGLKAWKPGRTTGFGPLGEAVERQAFFASAPA